MSKKAIISKDGDEIYKLESTSDLQLSDGWHTMDELYEFRKAYNACLFNEWYRTHQNWNIHKSWRHSDGELCFGKDNYFIVVAETPIGQISNHYHGDDWHLFDIEEHERAVEYDGHTPQQALERLLELAASRQPL